MTVFNSCQLSGTATLQFTPSWPPPSLYNCYPSPCNFAAVGLTATDGNIRAQGTHGLSPSSSTGDSLKITPTGQLYNGNLVSGSTVVTATPPAMPPPKLLGTTCSVKPSQQPPRACGEPITIAIGNLFEQFTDYQSGGHNKLAFTRFYDSLGNPSTERDHGI